MGDEGFEVRPEDLVAGAGAVTQAGTALSTARTTSTSAVGQAAGACGGGALAAALSTFGSGLDGAAQLLGTEMELTARALSGAATTYRSTDAAAASGIRGVRAPSPDTTPGGAP